MALKVTLVGGPTAVLDVAGLRILTDPTFDPPQAYPNPRVKELVKVRGSAFSQDELMPVDIVLVSHQHTDNLDHSGREFLNRVPHVFTTSVVADQFGVNVVGLAEYESVTVPRSDGGQLTITAVPAQHGPDGVWQLMGPVIGFVLSGQGIPTTYVSGDNSAVEVVKEINTKCGPIDAAILFAGGARFEMVADGAYITLSNEAALEAAKVLSSAAVVPVHTDSWQHFSQSADEMRALFDAEGLGDRIVTLKPGESVDLIA